MRCPQCSSDDYVAISINLKEEDAVEFFQCRACETKWWRRDGDTLELHEVLNLSSEVKPSK